MDVNNIVSTEIQNPIVLGEFISNKEFRLDINVLMNDNMTLYVIDLSKINLATEEDQQYHINYWASLFKATTLDEMKELATIDEYLEEATQEMRKLNADEEVRKRCLDRLEYYQDLKLHEELVKRLQSDNDSLKSDVSNLKSDIVLLKSQNQDKDALIKQLLEENQKLKGE